MTASSSVQNSSQKKTNLEEMILVVQRDSILKKEQINGFLPCSNFSYYEELIKNCKEFIPRNEAESDENYKQIIPYLVFNYQNKYFIMQRKSTASEQRLKNKFSLGIGGHLRQEDITTTAIADWAIREFCEEVHYSGAYVTQSLGIINDDSNEVGRVHIGFVILLKATSDAISIKSELKRGFLVTLDECKEYYDNLESWSQYVVTALDNYEKQGF